MSVTEVDAVTVSAALKLRKHVADCLDVIEKGKQLRTTYTKEMLEAVNTVENEQFSQLNFAHAIAKMSDRDIKGFEETLKDIDSYVTGELESLMEQHDLVLLSLFMAFMQQLKSKSKRHLQNFLEAATDDEWVDALIVGKGNDSEFRTIDRCSDSARSEFGLKS